MDEKKKVPVMIYERLSAEVITLANTLQQKPNELVNRIVEDAIRHINAPERPSGPLPIVRLARLILRRDLTQADRLLQNFLGKHIDGWAAYQEDWRDFVIEEANMYDGELTKAVLNEIKKRADKRANAKRANEKSSG